MVSCVTDLRREASNCLELRLKILTTNSECTDGKNREDVDETLNLYFLLKHKSDKYLNPHRHDTYFVVRDIPNSNDIPFNLQTFTNYLYKKFDIPLGSGISYMDNEGDVLPIDWDCEFVEMWRYARRCAEKNAVVTLLLDSTFRKYNYIVKCNARDIKVEEAAYIPMKDSHKSQSMHKMIQEANKSKEEETKCNERNVDVHDFIQSLITILNNSKSADSEAATTNKMDNRSPPLWFEEYMKTMKEDIAKEVSAQVTTTMIELLNKFSTNLSTELQSNRVKEESIPIDTPNTQYSSDDEAISSYPVERKQYKKKKKVTNKICTDNVPLDQAEIYYRIENLEEKMRNVVDRQKYYRRSTEMVNNLDRGYKKQEESNVGQNCTRQEAFSNVNLPLLDSQIDDSTYRVQKCTDNELRMNCSITGHQMLDNAKGTMFCSSELDNVSIGNDATINTNLYEEYNFEVIHMPTQCESNVLDWRNQIDDLNEEQKIENVSTTVIPEAENMNFTFCTLENNESGRESPSFELLSESPSPPVSLYMDDDHFSINEYNSTRATTATPATDSIEKVSNDESKSEYIYVIDVDGKIYDKYLFDDTKKCIDEKAELQKRTDGLYSFVAQTLPTNIKGDPDLSKSEYIEHKCECDPNIDVRSSHTSYTIHKGYTEWSKMTEQNNCQLQPDMSEFTQSFHSHTTSVTDEENRATSSTDSTRANDESDTTPDVNQSKKESASKTNTKCTRNTETNEDTRTTENTKSYSTHTSGFSEYSNQHAGNRSTGIEARILGVDLLNTGDPVDILPETLVTSAAHFAFLAYGTARDVIDKIRSHTEKVRTKRRNRR